MIQHIGKFAYSYDRETFKGSFDTRKEAVAAAVKSAMEMLNPPEAIYVGQRQAVDPGAAGHAEDIIERMRRTVFERHGERGADFLARVDEQQLADLDAAFEKTIQSWMERHQLGPHFERIGVVSEHPVPMGVSIATAATGTEVHEIGQSAEY